MGLKLSMFKTPKHRSFSFQPRYYDADKEKAEERKRIDIRRAKQGGGNAEEVKVRLRRGAMRQGGYYMTSGQSYRKANHRSSITFLVVLVVLVGLGFLLFNVFFPQIEAMFG